MASLNRATLIGNAGRDPEVRYLETPERPKVAQFTLATTERLKSRDGQPHEQTEWHNIVAWRGLADVAEKYIRKGSQLYIEGHIRTRSWESNGQKAYRTEIVADNIQLLGGRPDSQGAAPRQYAPVPQTAAPQQQMSNQPQGVPAYGMTAAQQPVYEQPQDDLPF